ncbi:MAG TPA: carboxylating nicotinate-nucleotide diphosphorylase [Sphingomonadales bacterium]|nr:carboxylating nicotinate-nucleotide diphosphorylase [Sphingomonadales bacterium]
MAEALSPAELRDFIARALKEDVGRGDWTTLGTVPRGKRITANMVARQDLVLAGADIAIAIFRRLAPKAQIRLIKRDGARVEKGKVILTIRGRARPILTAERAALNVVQHLSGIATLTAAYVARLKGTGTVLLDTRKTIPGLRRLEKYATRVGGAQNHRHGLYDAILIKDNHIAAAGGIVQAIRGAKRLRKNIPLEVECDTLSQLKLALHEGIDLVLLDNMSLAELRKAVKIAKGRAKIEASGGVTLNNIRAIARTGVEYISTSKITQSAPAADIALDFGC